MPSNPGPHFTSDISPPIRLKHVVAGLFVLMSVLAVAIYFIRADHSEAQTNSARMPATSPEATDALPGESIDSYKRRLAASQSPEPDPNSRIVVYVYPLSKNKKCVSLATGLLSWESGHPILTDYEFASGQRQEMIYRPNAAKADGALVDLPLIELPPPGASVNLGDSMYWAANRSLADAAQTDGFKLIDLSTIQDPDEFVQARYENSIPFRVALGQPRLPEYTNICSSQRRSAGCV